MFLGRDRISIIPQWESKITMQLVENRIISPKKKHLGLLSIIHQTIIVVMFKHV